MGSHLDTQPTGGKFDGALGVLGALEVMRTLHEVRLRDERAHRDHQLVQRGGFALRPRHAGVRRLRRRVHRGLCLCAAGPRRQTFRRRARPHRLSRHRAGGRSQARRDVRTSYRAGTDPRGRRQDHRGRHRCPGHALVRDHGAGPECPYRRNADASAPQRSAWRGARHRCHRRHRPSPRARGGPRPWV